MVYFKVNLLLARVLKLAEQNKGSAIGCTKDCDKQLLSLDDLEICLEIIRNRAYKIEHDLKEQDEIEEAKTLEDDSKFKKPQTKEEIQEAMRRMSLQAKALSLTPMTKTELS